MKVTKILNLPWVDTLGNTIIVLKCRNVHKLYFRRLTFVKTKFNVLYVHKKVVFFIRSVEIKRVKCMIKV